MVHDGEGNVCKKSIGNIMSPTLAGDNGLFSWSSCSRQYLTRFLRYAHAHFQKCLDLLLQFYKWYIPLMILYIINTFRYTFSLDSFFLSTHINRGWEEIKNKHYSSITVRSKEISWAKYGTLVLSPVSRRGVIFLKALFTDALY